MGFAFVNIVAPFCHSTGLLRAETELDGNIVGAEIFIGTPARIDAARVGASIPGKLGYLFAYNAKIAGLFGQIGLLSFFNFFEFAVRRRMIHIRPKFFFSHFDRQRVDQTVGGCSHSN